MANLEVGRSGCGHGRVLTKPEEDLARVEEDDSLGNDHEHEDVECPECVE